MNRAQAKKLVEALRFLSAVSENAFLHVIDDGIDAAERLANAEKELELLADVIGKTIRHLPTIHPEFGPLIQECDRESLERGRIWSEQRAEKIALLKLAGDDAPEEQIPV